MSNRPHVDASAMPQAPQPSPHATTEPTTIDRSFAFAEGTQPQHKLELAEGTSPGAPAMRCTADQAERANAIGELWSREYVAALEAQQREIVGGWPGTLREARRRVLAAMPRNLDPLLLDELAKITNLAARKGWESVSEPDLEP